MRKRPALYLISGITLSIVLIFFARMIPSVTVFYIGVALTIICVPCLPVILLDEKETKQCGV